MKRKELYSYIIIWLFIFAAQLFIFSSAHPRYWQKVYLSWFHLIPFAIAFFINNMFLVPKYLFNKKYTQYILAALVVIIVMDLLGSFSGIYLSASLDLPRMRNLLNALRPGALPRPIHLIIIDNLTFLVLTVGFGTAIKLVFKWLQEEKKRKELEKVQLKTELEMLRHQVSPHFFMNTLNNIHALIDINPETAKNSIIRLSKLMQYLLYDSSKGFTTLAKEVEFIKNYVSLMKLRFPEKVKISFNVSESLPEIQINSLLFTSFIENAFKHGISYQNDSFIDINLHVNDKELSFTISNSKHKKETAKTSGGSGLGLQNIRKSLELLYNDNYSLEINENETTFNIFLKVPLNEDKLHRNR